MKLSRTWWGNKFIDALEPLMDEGRLGRGRSYRGPNRILSFSITKNEVKATVRGNVNPYFGVYKEPKYKSFIKIKPFPKKKWEQAIKKISVHAGWMSKLLLNQMPDDIEIAFSDVNACFLPSKGDDLITSCSCPDWSNPCKHIAGVYFKLAAMLDHDPFLMFQLRGLSKKELQQLLSKTTLGKALASTLAQQENVPLQLSNSYYTEPQTRPLENCSLKDFWLGKKQIDTIAISNRINADESVPALLIKKQGDYPPFWLRDNSFIGAMESIYARVRVKFKS